MAGPSPSTRARSTWVGSGRRSGSFAGQERTSGSIPAGTLSRSGSSCTTRYVRSIASPPPKTAAPAAYASTAPREKTSPAGPTGRPHACSGE
ncbi:hypothetical protein RLT57_06900 [Streptomyces sp. ITFR-21]|nr:hypothetical protein [Streptomyces sp. ITFR-21]WNI15290.1 hypothetical protein RLT57_06900 [Streptomyces sp. ITFR-21]